MAGTSRQHRGEKRRKELARKAKQEEKRQRRTDRKEEPGGGPPIDWGELGASPEGGPGPDTPVAEPQSDTTASDLQGPETP